MSAAGRAQPASQQPVTTLADAPLGPAVTVTVERRGEIVLVGLNRPFIQNRIDPPTRLRLAETFYQYEHDVSLRALVLFGHLGIAPGSGPGDRGFESRLPDQFFNQNRSETCST